MRFSIILLIIIIIIIICVVRVSDERNYQIVFVIYDRVTLVHKNKIKTSKKRRIFLAKARLTMVKRNIFGNYK